MFKANRRRGYTGREAAEENEKDARRTLKQAQREAECQRRENEAISKDLRREHIARYAEADAQYQRQESIRQESILRLVPEDDFDDMAGLVFPGDTREPSDGIDNVATTITSDQDELSDDGNRSSESSDSDSNSNIIPSSHPADDTTTQGTSIQVPATAPTSTRTPLRTDRKRTRRFKSQHQRDIAMAELKEQRRKQREAKANRTGTGRAKAAEALAQPSQLLDGVELPFRSSQ
jgi:hypothetical protein